MNNTKFYAMVIVFIYKHSGIYVTNLHTLDDIINYLHDYWFAWFNDLYQSTLDSSYVLKFDTCNNIVIDDINHHFDLSKYYR
jgi:hypothetical protein